MSPKHTLAEVFHAFGGDYVKNNRISFQQLKVMSNILHCRTPIMGEHWYKCDDCGHMERFYNSCGDRHCPSCQGVNKERWILERTYDLLPVKYFHVVFTLPWELRLLFMQNSELLYDLLFKCSWQTLREFALDSRQNMQADIGAIAILHTWTQQLMYHPHIHMIVPGGGINKNNIWKTSKGSDDFLFYVGAVAEKFRGKFLDILYKELFLQKQLKLNGKLEYLRSKTEFYSFKNKLYDKKWVVNCKEPFKSPDTVIEYLARYTHKIAISNYRILDIDKENRTVTFSYLDREDNNSKKSKTLPADKFIRRFLLHVLPKGFTKIRHYGFLSSRIKKKMLEVIREALHVIVEELKGKLSVSEVMKATLGRDQMLCSKCGTGTMKHEEFIPKIRGQPIVDLLSA